MKKDIDTSTCRNLYRGDSLTSARKFIELVSQKVQVDPDALIAAAQGQAELPEGSSVDPVVLNNLKIHLQTQTVDQKGGNDEVTRNFKVVAAAFLGFTPRKGK